MRHGRKFNHLGVNHDRRKLLLSGLAKSLIKHKRIVTTLAKAKALRTYVEPIITKTKENTTHSRRVVFSYFQDKETVKELFNNVSDLIGERNGGYLRIIKMGKRYGDAAEMGMIEFVDFNKTYVKKVNKKTKTKNTKSKTKEKAPVKTAKQEETQNVASV